MLPEGAEDEEALEEGDKLSEIANEVDNEDFDIEDGSVGLRALYLGGEARCCWNPPALFVCLVSLTRGAPGVGHLGFEQLAQNGIRGSRALRVLDVQGAARSKQLARRALALTRAAVRRLNLGNHLEEDTITQLCAAVGESRVRRLNLGRNAIRGAGGLALCALLERSALALRRCPSAALNAGARTQWKVPPAPGLVADAGANHVSAARSAAWGQPSVRTRVSAGAL